MICDKNPLKIKSLFDEISKYYDKMNNIISFGTHYFIKYFVVKSLDLRPNTILLDICCGSGDFTKIVKTISPSTKVIGLDFSKEMIKLAKIKKPKEAFIVEDCTELPFSQEEFDYITAGFGLRNVENRTKALNEISRTLKKGGKFLHLDFGYHNILSKIFDFIVPILVKIFDKNLENYNYLLNSKNTYPNPDELIKEFEQHEMIFKKKISFFFGAIIGIIMQKDN